MGRSTATWSYATVGIILHGIGRHAEAEEYLHTALQNRKRMLSPCNGLTLRTYRYLIDCLCAQAKVEAAVATLTEELSLRRQVLGNEDTGTLECVQRLAALNQPER